VRAKNQRFEPQKQLRYFEVAENQAFPCKSLIFEYACVDECDF